MQADDAKRGGMSLNYQQTSWLAAHLYYASPWEQFLVDALAPFVRTVLAQKQATQFFFIRYRERGPHIRLRFKGSWQILENEVKPALIRYFEHYFVRWPSHRTDPDWTGELPSEQQWFNNNSVQFIPYEPELTRYGGPVGMTIAEKQFEISSRIALKLIEENKAWTYERALGAAIQLHLGLVTAFGLNLLEAKQFFNMIFNNWFARAYDDSSGLAAQEATYRRQVTLDAFAKSYDKQRPFLVAYHQTLWNACTSDAILEPDWYHEWLCQMKEICHELKVAQAQNQLQLPQFSQKRSDFSIWWRLLGSYVHMTNNRLGIANRDEAFLGYLIIKSLESVTDQKD